MKIFAKELTGRLTTLECDSTDTIAHIKAQLEDKTGFPVDEQRIIFNGIQLSGDFCEYRTLNYYRIPNEATIVVPQRLRGGAAGE
ncbi:hypothetical protein LUZ61_020337 [Rhynchospora tenuis]|uniref:Ubiquitin-like domain-containing protein n=1 Tax=Rhynchospora tenuis TaxID=198213 RepID=A0AAD6ENR1_9POAL|nr:hypothetical protein LUZ61_020337 [Rhynchospora tenuis]